MEIKVNKEIRDYKENSRSVNFGIYSANGSGIFMYWWNLVFNDLPCYKYILYWKTDTSGVLEANERLNSDFSFKYFDVALHSWSKLFHH